VDLNVLKPRSVVTRLIGTVADFSRKRAHGIIALGDDMKARLVARGIAEHKILVAVNWGDGCEILPAPFEEGDGVSDFCAIDAQGREEYQLAPRIRNGVSGVVSR